MSAVVNVDAANSAFYPSLVCDGCAETMQDWDEEKLEQVVRQKHSESDMKKPKTEIVSAAGLHSLLYVSPSDLCCLQRSVSRRDGMSGGLVWAVILPQGPVVFLRAGHVCQLTLTLACHAYNLVLLITWSCRLRRMRLRFLFYALCLLHRYVNTSWRLLSRASTAGSGSALMVIRASTDMHCHQVCLSVTHVLSHAHTQQQKFYCCQSATFVTSTGPQLRSV